MKGKRAQRGCDLTACTGPSHPSCGSRRIEVAFRLRSCPGFSYIPLWGSHFQAILLFICRQEYSAWVHRQGKVGVVMAPQGVLSVGFRAHGEMSGKNLPSYPCSAMYDVFNRFCLSINE